MELGEFVVSKRDLEVALEADPESPKTLFLFYLLESREGNQEKAQKLLQKLCQSSTFDKEMVLMAAKHVFQVPFFSLSFNGLYFWLFSATKS